MTMMRLLFGASEPSYFQRPSPLIADPVDAEVLWFNASKGFGFVKLPDGSEVFLPFRVLEAAGNLGIFEGSQLKVVVGETPRGSQIVQVIETGQGIAKSPSCDQIGRSAPATATANPEIEGTVKWYNAEKASASSRRIAAKRMSSSAPLRSLAPE